MATAALGAILGLAAALPAGAVDVTGMTLLASFDEHRMRANSQMQTLTRTLEIYFGTKGNRFVLFHANRSNSTSENRVLVPAGSNRGSARRKDTNFQLIVQLQQSAGALQVTLESRGKDTGYANERWTISISLTGGGCRVDNYRYVPDPRLNYSRISWKGGNCTLTQGPPSGLTERD